MLVGIKIKTNFKGEIFNKVSSALHRQWFLWQNEVVEIGEQTVKVMRDRIEQTRKREKSEEGLSSLIDIEILDTKAKIHFGIGNTDILKEKVPYYRFINYGGMLPAKSLPAGIFSNFPAPSKFVPQTGRWLPGEFDENGKKYTFIPKKPIEGKHYIEAGQEYFKRKIKEAYLRYVAETRKETRRRYAKLWRF